MSTDLKKLREAGVKPLSVKADAFTFRKEDEEKVREILNVKAGIGEWRIEKKGDEVKLPREYWEKKQNEKNKNTNIHKRRDQDKRRI